MCIIVIKNKGVNFPKNDLLKNCWDRNSDGAGVMYVIDGSVHFKKGFMKYEEFALFIEKLHETLTIDVPICYHFRIGTQGGNTAENTHPFVISNNIDELKLLDGSCEIGMMHNGIISGYRDASCGHSDTQLFIVDIIDKIYKINPEFIYNEDFLHIINKIAGSRLCFINKNEDIVITGDGWIEDIETKLIFSNKTYEPRVINWLEERNRTNKRWYGYYGYDDDDDDDTLFSPKDFSPCKNSTDEYDKTINYFGEIDNDPKVFELQDLPLDTLTVLKADGLEFEIDNSSNKYFIDAFYNLYAGENIIHTDVIVYDRFFDEVMYSHYHPVDNKK